ncbi:MAG: hypothetical protein ACFBSE_02720 [Prochloraceae cyanobacterium]
MVMDSSQSLETLSSLAESLMKKRPDEVVKIVLEFSQDDELLKEIVNSLKMFHYDLFENGQDYAVA